MNRILVYIGVQDGQPKRASLEVLSHCLSLSDKHGFESRALILHPDALAVAETLQKYGPSHIYTISHPVFKTHLNAHMIAGLEAGFRLSGADMMAFASTEPIKDVLGALAIRTNASVIPDVIRFEWEGSTIVGVRPVMAGKLLARTRALSPPFMVSVRSGSYEVVERPGSCEVEEIDFVGERGGLRLTLQDVALQTAESVDLSEARVVVAAGRGVMDEEGQQLVERLAGLLGAAIGSSRAIVESGLFSPTTQIGQTGRVVSPELYFALGISGAIQHVAGMSNSRVIVAVNKDPDAPIFEYATYGLVGDLYEILPLLITELKNVLNEA